MSRIEVYILAFHFPLQVLLYPGATTAPVNLSYERKKKGHDTDSSYFFNSFIADLEKGTADVY